MGEKGSSSTLAPELLALSQVAKPGVISLCSLVCAVTACTEPGSDIDFGGSVFWDEIDTQDAEDLGHEAAPIPEDDQRQPGPITLTDVTQSVGLGDAIGGGNQHGVGVAFVDLDADGFAEVFIANGRNNPGDIQYVSSLFRNRGDGSFEDVTQSSNVEAILGDRDCYSVAAADYDGDGDVDLYVGAQPTDVLLRNLGDGSFEDATEVAGAGGPPSNAGLVIDGRSKVVAFGDYDADGDQDIVSSSSTLDMPFAYLLENRGDGSFLDVTDESGVFASVRGNPCAVMWSDYDTDGLIDLQIWNDRGDHVLLGNGGGSFTDRTSAAKLDAVTITHPMGIDAGDIDHDGDLDYYVSNIGNNPLLRNNGDGTFTDVTTMAGTGGDYGWGLGFEDFDRDGWVDIFVAQEDDRPHLVFRNEGEGGGPFARIEVPHPPVMTMGAAHNVAVAFADYDHDGRVDVLVAGTDGSPIQLYRNETDLGTAGWLDILLRPSDGPESSEGIGARIAVQTGDITQFDDVTGGSSRASQNEHGVRFGLGQWDGVESVAVLWPTGRQTVLTGVEAGQRLVLTD